MKYILQILFGPQILRTGSPFTDVQHVGNLLMRISLDRKEVQHGSIPVGKFAYATQQFGFRHFVDSR